MRNRSGVIQSGAEGLIHASPGAATPASRCGCRPPASARPRGLSDRGSRGRPRIMHRAVGSVAAVPILPVEVLMKSAPAAIASIEARRIWS